MQVIVPVKGKGEDKLVIAEGFHTTSYLCVYNIETESIDWIDADEITQYSGNITDELRKLGYDTVITNQMSFMAYGLFMDGGFLVFKSQGNDLKQNIELLKNRQLELLTTNTTFKSSSCGSSCNSCDSTCKN